MNNFILKALSLALVADQAYEATSGTGRKRKDALAARQLQ